MAGDTGHRVGQAMAGVFCLLVSLLVMAVPAAAQTFDVTDPGDAGPGTFRQAVEDANASAAGAVTIAFDPGLSIVLTTGQVEYTAPHDLTLAGNGSTLDADNSSRILLVTDADVHLTVEDLTFVNGAFGIGGALSTPGDLTVVDSAFTDNSAGADGGAIEAHGVVTIMGSSFSGNSTNGEGGALWVPTSLGPVVGVTIIDSTFTQNEAGDGGAIFTAGRILVSGSTFEDNTAVSHGRGGAIRARWVTGISDSTFHSNNAGNGGAIGTVTSGPVTVTNSVFQHNVATNNGGAISSGGGAISGSVFRNNTAEGVGGSAGHGGAITTTGVFDVVVSDTTFAFNKAAGHGGAFRAPGPADVTITGSTFMSNMTDTDGGAVYAGASTTGMRVGDSTFSGNHAGGEGGAVWVDDDLWVDHVTVAANSGTQLVVSGPLHSYGSVATAPQAGDSCDIGKVTTSTYSYDTDGSCGFAHASDVSNGGNPQLLPIGDNGGPTWTRMPAETSPLLDAIPAPCAASPGTDQRGVARPQGQGCDIGAVEREVEPDPEPEPPEPGVVRYAGANRFETAAMLSAASFEPGVDVVYVATGLDYPDALTGAVAAALDEAPLLLVTRDAIPQETADELARLEAGGAVILGGTSVVDESVALALSGMVEGPVERRSGPDRFATAVAVSQAAFPSGADVVYVGTGLNFPDALAGVPAGATAPGPLLLVTTDQVPASTVDELTRLEPERIVMLGGTAAVGDAVAAALAPYATDIDRLGGSDRFATAAGVASATFGDPSALDTVFVATGGVFPDALAAGAIAGAMPAPVLLTGTEILPDSTIAELERISPRQIVVMGGVRAVNDAVEAQLGAYIVP